MTVTDFWFLAGSSSARMEGAADDDDGNMERECGASLLFEKLSTLPLNWVLTSAQAAMLIPVRKGCVIKPFQQSSSARKATA